MVKRRRRVINVWFLFYYFTIFSLALGKSYFGYILGGEWGEWCHGQENLTQAEIAVRQWVRFGLTSIKLSHISVHSVASGSVYSTCITLHISILYFINWVPTSGSTT